MGTWKGIVGASFGAAEFDRYCHALAWTAWRPSFVVLHNTAVPSLAQQPNGLTHEHMRGLAQRPTGFSPEHMRGLEAYYRDVQRWNAGPHLFVDDRKIWVFTPLTVSGVHSPSWNKLALGVEMLGDFATEPFATGRGARVRANTVAALATLHAVLGLDPATLRLHREDILTTHRCPGDKVPKADVIRRVQELLVTRHAGEHLQSEPMPNPPA